VDKEKGYIDLSKRRVAAEDIQKCEDRFAKAKKVHQTVRQVAQKHHMKVEELNEKVVWPLYKKYGHALDALKDASLNPDEIFQNMSIPDDIRESFLSDVKLRLSPQIMKLRARFEIFCFGYEGIDAVKFALVKGREVAGDSKVELKIRLVAPPLYEIVTAGYDREEAVGKIDAAMKMIDETIRSYKGGEFKRQGEIIVVGGDEDRTLTQEDEEETSEEESEEDEGMGVIGEGVPDDDVQGGDESDDEKEEEESKDDAA